MGVDIGGAGDQGIMFGYACNDTENYMPYAIDMAHKLARRITQVRKENIVSFFLVIIILIIIVFTVLFSLDMCGIISLPEKLSLKTYLSDTIEVVGFGKKEEIYYPDYDATGIQDLENI